MIFSPVMAFLFLDNDWEWYYVMPNNFFGLWDSERFNYIDSCFFFWITHIEMYPDVIHSNNWFREISSHGHIDLNSAMNDGTEWILSSLKWKSLCSLEASNPIFNSSRGTEREVRPWLPLSSYLIIPSYEPIILILYFINLLTYSFQKNFLSNTV